MASVTKIVPEVVIPEITYRLELSKKELTVLQILLGHIGGSGPCRNTMSDISDALDEFLSFWDNSDNDDIGEFFEWDAVLEELDWLNKEIPEAIFY